MKICGYFRYPLKAFFHLYRWMWTRGGISWQGILTVSTRKVLRETNTSRRITWSILCQITSYSYQDYHALWWITIPPVSLIYSYTATLATPSCCFVIHKRGECVLYTGTNYERIAPRDRWAKWSQHWYGFVAATLLCAMCVALMLPNGDLYHDYSTRCMDIGCYSLVLGYGGICARYGPHGRSYRAVPVKCYVPTQGARGNSRPAGQSGNVSDRHCQESPYLTAQKYTIISQMITARINKPGGSANERLYHTTYHPSSIHTLALTLDFCPYEARRFSSATIHSK